MKQNKPQQVCWGNITGRSGLYLGAYKLPYRGSHTEEPQQCEEMGWKETCEAQQAEEYSLALGEEKLHSSVHSGGWPGGKCLTENNLYVLMQQVKHEPAICIDEKNLNDIPGCIRQSIASKCGRMILPIYSALVRTHLWSHVQSWTPQYRRDMDILVREQWRLQE